MLVHYPWLAINPNDRFIRRYNLYIAHFPLKNFAELFQIEFRRQVFAPTHFAIHEEQLLHTLFFQRQIAPRVLMESVTGSDRAAAKRVFNAMMQMRKIDIATIEAARRG